MEDDIDIYEDLPSFGTEFCENFISNNGVNTVEEQLELKKQIAELTTKLENFQKVNQNLEINLFSLLKTAKAEIARKDKMIDELRKKLDDVTFKRGIHSKTNDYNIHKSTFRETIVNAHHKSTDKCFSSNENNVKTADCSYNQTRDQQNKSTLIPITVFGERLLKRMTDEQNLEKKDKYLNKISISNNDNTNNEGYVIESDKENGFLSDINFSNTKEIPSSTVEQYKENEHIKNPSALLKSTLKDFVSSNKSEISSTFQQKPILVTTDTRKRVNEETNRYSSTKRIKSTGDEYLSKTIKKEIDDSTILDSHSKCSLPHNNNLEPSSHSKEKQYTIKNTVIGYTRNSSAELKKHDYFVNDTKKEDERKDIRNKNVVSYYKKDANERSLKRRNKSVQNTISTLDRKDTDCYIEVFKRDNYRSNYSEHHHKTKQKEHHRTENHRSRIKSTSYIKPSREDKYNRNQYKHTNYDAKFEERYNFRNIGTDKSKNSKKDLCNAHNEMKYSTTHRVSTNQKGDNMKKANSYNEYDSRKIRLKDTNRQIKRENKRDEYNEYSDRKVNEEHFTNHVKYSEVSKRNCEKDNEIIERMNCILPIENKLGIHDKLQNHAKKELQNSSIDFVGSELSSTLHNNSLTNGNDAYEKFKNQEDARKIPNLLSTENNQVIKNPINHNMKFEAMEKSKISSDILQTTPISNTIITSLREQKSSENIETIENVENVENIEKFIRDYTSTSDSMFTKISETSNIIESMNDSPSNLTTKEENINDVRNYEQNLEACDNMLTSNNLYDENYQLNKTSSIFDEKSINTSENHISKNNLQLIKNDCAEMQTEQTISLKHAKDILQENKCIGLNYMKLTQDNHSANNSMQQISELGMIDHSSENIMKENVFQNSYACSTIIRKSSKEMDEKMNNYGNVNTAHNIIKSKHDNFNNHNENKINPNSPDNISTINANYNNTDVLMDTVHKRDCSKDIGEMESLELKEFKKPLQRTRNDNRNAKITSTNVHGKLVVFARRKKPVCLANSNANMTVLINNNPNASVNLTTASDVETSSYDTTNMS
ncbi:PREDICTED: uncharacterized protein DDB_G0287625 [Eufriesea mexicana]|uniref:uncharacterized protein DDB_G0287625 n=1 Tax=Eufriesea mexicana TaxID=516756 RepID=UPI00083C482B|nr:PREDICTED: uncharacterized protein DDB_G0287625 [Eufriesea mexicana]